MGTSGDDGILPGVGTGTEWGTEGVWTENDVGGCGRSVPRRQRDPGRTRTVELPRRRRPRSYVLTHHPLTLRRDGPEITGSLRGGDGSGAVSTETRVSEEVQGEPDEPRTRCTSCMGRDVPKRLPLPRSCPSHTEDKERVGTPSTNFKDLIND